MRISSAFAGCRRAWVPWQVTHRARAPVTSRKVPSPPHAPCSGSSIALACCSVLSYICCCSRAEIADTSSGGGKGTPVLADCGWHPGTLRSHCGLSEPALCFRTVLPTGAWDQFKLMENRSVLQLTTVQRIQGRLS